MKDCIKQNQLISKKEKYNSLIAALFLFETLICKMITVFIEIPYISVWLVMILMTMFVLVNSRYHLSVLKKSSIVFGLLLGLLLISGVLNGFEYVSTYLQYFIVFGTMGLLIWTVDINYNQILIYSLRISIIYIVVYFFFERRKFIHANTFWNEQMGIAYGVLIPAVVGMATIIYKNLFKLKKSEWLLAWIISFFSLYVIFVDCGTRGAIVAAIIAAGLLFIAKEKAIKKNIFFILILIFAILVIQNMEEILMYAYTILTKLGIDFPALTKMVWMLQRGIADNGRNEIYELGIQIFKSSPLLGKGVGYFELKSGVPYVHNFFIQLLNEIGLLGTICFLSPILQNFVKNFFSKRQIEKKTVFQMILFAITIPMLFFSSSYWLLPSFWLYFYEAIKEFKIRKIKR